MPQFKTFDYGNVLAQEANIRGSRTRNALAQQQLDPNSVGNQLQREQLAGAKQRNVLAGEQGVRQAAQEGRAQTQFDQQTQQYNSKFLHQSLVRISQDPSAADELVPQLKQMGIMKNDFDYSSMSPEEISAKAAEGAAALGKALGIKPVDKSFTLGQGQQRFDSAGKQIAQVAPKSTGQGLKAKDLPSNVKQRETAKLEARNEMKRKVAKPKVKATMLALERQTGVVNKNIDKALGAISEYSTGAGSWFSFMPNSEAKKLALILDTVKANVGFDKLQQMRDNSQTGGALGQVSEFENRLLQAVNGALDPAQRDLLEENLASIRELYSAVLNERKAAYNADYGDEFDIGQAAGGQEMSIDDLVKKYAQ